MILYHYCSTAAFYSIFKYRSVYLSSLTSSNDAREGRWLSEVLRKVLAKKKAKPSVAQKLLHLLSGVEEESLAYGFCLSVKRDMLSQWRGYADDGTGLAIGFKKEAIEAVLAPAGVDKLVPPRLLPVAYGESDQEALVEAEVEAILEGLGGETLLPPTILTYDNARYSDYPEALDAYTSDLEMARMRIGRFWEFVYATKNSGVRGRAGVAHYTRGISHPSRLSVSRPRKRACAFQ